MSKPELLIILKLIHPFQQQYKVGSALPLCLPSRSVLFCSVPSRFLASNNISNPIPVPHMYSDRTAQLRAFGRPDPTNPQTTFVQADPWNFRSIVQKLTGAPEVPLTLSPSLRPAASSRPPVCVNSNVYSPHPASSKHGFKLHERRQRKLDTIQLGNRYHRQQHHQGHHAAAVMVSPVSPLELFGSPRTPSVLSPKEEEEKAIAEKGFYLHPVSSLGGGDPPELLPLFPLHSPREQQQQD